MYKRGYHRPQVYSNGDGRRLSVSAPSSEFDGGKRTWHSILLSKRKGMGAIQGSRPEGYRQLTVSAITRQQNPRALRCEVAPVSRGSHFSSAVVSDVKSAPPCLASKLNDDLRNLRKTEKKTQHPSSKICSCVSRRT